MAWNLFLSLVPLVLALALFPRHRGRWAVAAAAVAGSAFLVAIPFVGGHAATLVRQIGPGWIASAAVVTLLLLLADAVTGAGRERQVTWWVGVFAFLVFLPNAPYVLTDVLHLPGDLARAAGHLQRLALTLEYVAFFAVGFEAYVLSLLATGSYLRRTGRGEWVAPVEVALTALCSAGVYLGRVLRLNSWDVALRPHAVLGHGLDSLVQPRSLAAMTFVFVVVLVLYETAKVLHIGARRLLSDAMR